MVKVTAFTNILIDTPLSQLHIYIYIVIYTYEAIRKGPI